jgi:hypothetical protein
VAVLLEVLLEQVVNLIQNFLACHGLQR